MNGKSQEPLLTVKQAAQILGVAANTVRAWGAAGKIPEYRPPMNDYRLYRRLDLEQVLRQVEVSVGTVAISGTGTGAGDCPRR